MPVGAGAGECGVARDVHQVGQERVARLARRPFELTQGMLSARASRKQSVPDGKRAEHRQALVIVGQGVHQLGEKFKGMSVRFQVHSGGRRGGASLAEHGGVVLEIRQERFAGGDRHGPARLLPDFV